MILSEEIKADLQRAKVACLIVVPNTAVRSGSLADPILFAGGFDSMTLIPPDLGIRSQQGRIQGLRRSDRRVLAITRSDVFVVACFTRSETFILREDGEVVHPRISPCLMSPVEITTECFGVPRIMSDYWRLKEDRMLSLIRREELTTEEMLEIQHIKAEFEMDEEDDDDV